MPQCNCPFGKPEIGIADNCPVHGDAAKEKQRHLTECRKFYGVHALGLEDSTFYRGLQAEAAHWKPKLAERDAAIKELVEFLKKIDLHWMANGLPETRKESQDLIDKYETKQ